MSNDITEFHGQYRFLSNFAEAEVEYEGVAYPTVEHAYVAAKTDSPEERKVIQSCPSAGGAKRLGRGLKLRPGWTNERLVVMEALLRQKFTIPLYRKQLIETYPRKLIEGNYWSDHFWGVCNGKGENNLGKLLMKIRDELVRIEESRRVF